LEDYATLGIPEYWIADYAAIGGIHYLGQPKQPTLSIHISITPVQTSITGV
jgi:Uma2 family endonuclease